MAYEYELHRDALEQLLTRVPGVHGVHINRDAAGAICDLSVEVAPHSDMPPIVAGIRAVLSAHGQFGPIPPAIMLIPAALPPVGLELRVQLREIVHTRGQPFVTVTLALHGRRIVGIGRGPAGTTVSPEYLAADATVRAINRMIKPSAQLRLEHVRRTGLGLNELCLVQLAVAAGQDVQAAIGVSIIRGDAPEAAARAVLDAANRYLPRLLTVPT